MDRIKILSMVILTSWSAARAQTCCPVLSADEVASRLTQASRVRAVSMSGYEATRTYALDNARLDQHAVMTVRAAVRYPDDKEFEILSVSGPEWMRGALRRILEGESSRGGPASNRLQIVSDNYHFRNAKLEKLLDRETYVLEIEPKAKNASMLRGRLWVDAHDFAVVRFEGQTAGRISFWAGTPQVTQTFVKVGSAWLPEANHSSASSFIFGKMELTVAFSDYVLHGPSGVRIASATQ